MVISDVHLGTYGCHAKELLLYMKSIKPKKVILNGDIIDIWQFSKRYWPKSHMQIVKQITNWIVQGSPVYYVTGNHDEMLRKFVGFHMASFKVVNKLEGVPVHGYFYWTFIDDFEWAEGYYPRFRLVYNHCLKQERVVKQSGRWWQKFLQETVTHNGRYLQ